MHSKNKKKWTNKNIEELKICNKVGIMQSKRNETREGDLHLRLYSGAI